MIKSSAHEGRSWKPSKTNEEYDLATIDENIEAFAAVAEITEQTAHELRMAVATRKSTEGMNW